MLILNTRDNWQEATSAITIGASTAVYVPPAAVDSIYGWAQGLTDFFGSTFTVSASFAFARDSLSGGLILQVTAGSSFTYTPSVPSLLLAGIVLIATPTASVAGTMPAAGTWGPAHYGLDGWIRDPSFKGTASGSGAVGQMSASTAHRRPYFRALCSALEAAQLALVQTRGKTPRRAHIFQHTTNAWRQVSVGGFSRTKTGPLIYTITAEIVA